MTMRFRVGDAEDSIVIEGETIEEIRERATRGGTDPWSEELP